MNILEEIIAHKKIEVEKSKERLSLDKLKNLVKARVEAGFKPASIKPASFFETLKNKTDKKQIALIAEVKKASPSKGVIREDFNPIEIAKAYKAGGATCLSVLTDEKYFQGNLNYIQEIKNVIDLPILRKDFIIDQYQIYESAYNQADCILLIVGAFCVGASRDLYLLRDLHKIACENGIDVLIEIHDKKEMEIALNINPQIIGINNRDLKTFQTNLDTTKTLIEKYKRDLGNKIVVSESGIFTNEDVKSLIEHGVYTFLIGESLMKERDIEAATKKLLS